MRVKLVAIVTWLLTIGFIYPLQSKIYPKEDSVMTILSELPHDVKRLGFLSNLACLDETSIKTLYYSGLLLEEAKLQKNGKYQSLALYHQLKFYYLQNDREMVQHCFAEIDSVARRMNNYDVFFQAYGSAVDLSIVNENHELAIDEATKMLEMAKSLGNDQGEMSAYLILAEAYFHTSRNEKAFEMIKNSYNKIKPTDSLYNQIAALTRICSILDAVKETVYQKTYLDLLNGSLEKYLSQNSVIDPIITARMMNCADFYLRYYIRTKQSELAHSFFLKASQFYKSDMYPYDRAIYYKANAEYYCYNGMYDNAAVATDSLLNIVRKLFRRDYFEALVLKADILTLSGDKKAAIPIYQQMIAMKDSIQMNLFSNQMKQMRERYKLDELLMIQEKKKNRMELIALGTLFLVFLILAFIAFLIYRSRGKQRLSERELRLATEQMEEANQVKEHFLANMNISVQKPVNTVIQYSNLIADNPELNQASMQKYSTIIQKNSDYLLGLINDVLELSRLESGTKVFNFSVNNMVSICEEAIHIILVKSDNKSQISFYTDLKEAYVQIDMEMMSKRLSEILKSREEEEERKISFYLDRKENQPVLLFRIYGSYLCEETNEINHEISLQNDMNRLVFEHMGGVYQVVMKQGEDKPYIFISFPICDMSEASNTIKEEILQEETIDDAEMLDTEQLEIESIDAKTDQMTEMVTQSTASCDLDMDGLLMDGLIVDALNQEELNALKEEFARMKSEKTEADLNDTKKKNNDDRSAK